MGGDERAFPLAVLADVYRPRVEAELHRVAESWPPKQKLYEAMRYALLAGGKRMRPLTVLACAYAVGGEGAARRAVPVAAAVEMVHVFTLIHDDLPCMDDSDFRWSRPTCHKAFGEDVALLAGDALLNEAYRYLSTTSVSGLFKKQILKVIEVISSAIRSVVHGQVLDLAAEGKDVSRDSLREIHLNKTAALLEACCVCGGIVGNLSIGRLKVLGEFGREMGLAYQIRDDLLMFEGDEKSLGKPVDLDEQKKKATYPRLLGIDESRELMEAARKRSLAHLEKLKLKARLLPELLDFAIARVK